MPLPRLTEIGDSAVLTVLRCEPVEVDDGPAVRFTFEGYPDDILTLPRLGVDGALLQMNLVLPEEAKGEGPVIDYAGLTGERFKFSRGTPKRGTRPTWKIEKVLPLLPVAPPAPEVKPARASAPTPVAEAAGEPSTFATRHPLRMPGVVSAVNDAAGAPDGPTDEEDRRAVIRAAYLRELGWVLDEPLKAAKKKKVELDINAAVAFLCIQMDRRRCL